MQMRIWLLVSCFIWILLLTVVISAPDMMILWPEIVKEGGRSINITCRLTDNDQCHAGSWFELFDNQTGIPLARKPCQADMRNRAVFAINLRENSPFGQFRCLYRGQTISANSLQINYRFCSDDSRACLQHSECDNDTEMKFCVSNKYGAMACSKITDRDWCIAEERRSVYRFCPINQRSMCSAIFHTYRAVWFKMYYADGGCPYGVTQPSVQYMGIGRLYEEPFAISPTDRNIIFLCNEGGPFFSRKVFLTVGASLNLSEYGTSHLRCELTTPVSEEFRVIQWWSRKSNGSAHFYTNAVRGPLEAGHSWMLKTDHTDEYQCHVTISYKTCSPHRTFGQQLNSEKIFVSAGWKLNGIYSTSLTISIALLLRIIFRAVS